MKRERAEAAVLVATTARIGWSLCTAGEVSAEKEAVYVQAS